MTTDTSTVEIDEAPAPEVPQGFRNYTVLAQAVTVLTGEVTQGKHQSVRVLKGNTINADPTNDSIRTLLGFRAIIATSKMPKDGRDLSLTAKGAFDVAKRAGEATAVRVTEVEPLTAPAVVSAKVAEES